MCSANSLGSETDEVEICDNSAKPSAVSRISWAFAPLAKRRSSGTLKCRRDVVGLSRKFVEDLCTRIGRFNFVPRLEFDEAVASLVYVDSLRSKPNSEPVLPPLQQVIELDGIRRFP